MKFGLLFANELTDRVATDILTKIKKSDYTDNIAVSRKCIEEVTKLLQNQLVNSLSECRGKNPLLQPLAKSHVGKNTKTGSDRICFASGFYFSPKKDVIRFFSGIPHCSLLKGIN